MKRQGTDANALHKHHQKFHYKLEVVQVHYSHDLLHFVVSDDGPLGPFPRSSGFVVPLFLSIRTRLYQLCINPSNLTRTNLQLNCTAEEPLLKVQRKVVS